jgi:hypothetical protein
MGVSGSVDVDEWLEDWAVENIQTPGYYEEKNAMKSEADACRADATAAGISIADLTRAAGGDLERYLLRAQNSFTDAEVQRKVDKDD